MKNLDHLIAQLAQHNAPRRAAPHPFLISATWLGYAAGYFLIALLLSGTRPDLAARLHNVEFVAEIVLLLTLVLASSVSAALLAFPDAYQKPRWTKLPLAFMVAFMLLLVLAYLADNPPAPQPLHSWQCTMAIVMVAIIPGAWTLWVMRRFAAIQRGMAGSVAVLFAFSVSALWLRLHELNDSISHVIYWHYLPMLIFAIVGWWLGKRVLRW
ncbi:MAG: DUF1109 domain-containing protein [Gallionella sp.]